MRVVIGTLTLALCALTAACGDTQLQRGATGAAIGAGVGQVVADEPLGGAAVGAGAGILSQ